MTRASRSNPSRKRRKKILQIASGYNSSKRYRLAKARVAKGMQYQYAHRKVRKRDFRALWIVRINAAVREAGLKYSVFINLLKKTGLNINRKMLCKFAMEKPSVFAEIISSVKKEGSV